MKGIKVNLKKNNPGATLMMVVGTFAILLILMTAALSTATMAQRQTHMQYNKSQAYYIANSAVNTFIAGLENNNELNKAILGLTTGESFNSKKYEVKGAGEVEYNVKRDANDKIVVVAKAYYNNSNSQAAVILDGKLKNPKLPNFTAATVTLSDSNYAEEFGATGDVMGKGLDPDDPFTLNNDSKIKGNVFVDGYLQINNNTEIKPGTNKTLFYVESTKSITMTNGTSIICSDAVSKTYVNTSFFKADSGAVVGSSIKDVDIYANSVEIHDFVTVYGNLHLYKKDGAAPSYNNPRGGHSYVHQGDLYIEGDYVHSAGAMRVNGDIHVTGTLTVDSLLSANNIMCDQLIVNTAQASVTSMIYTPNTIGGTNGGSFASKKTWNGASDSSKLVMPIRPEMNDPEEIFAPYTITSEEFKAFLDPDMFKPEKEINVPWQGTANITESCTLSGKLYNSKINITVTDEPIWICLKGEDGIVNLHTLQSFILNMSTTKPETPVFFYVPENVTVMVNNAAIVSQNTLDKISAGDIFYAGNYANPSVEVTKGQPIYWFLDRKGTVNIDQKALVEGYMFAPFMNGDGENIDVNNENNLDVNNDNGGKIMNISPDGIAANAMEVKPKVIGAVVSNRVSFSEEAGIAFFPPNQSGIPGIGEGGLAADFKVEEFTRN